MAGYVRDRKLYRLRFEDAEYDGFEVLVKAINLGQLEEVTRLADEITAAEDEHDQVRLTRDIIGRFADVLVKWNLQQHADSADDDSPLVDVPATFDGLLEQDVDFVMYLIDAWMSTTAGVDAPLGQRSSDGRPSEELAPLMETLSPSLAS